jgi:hypothetical protein
LLAPAHQKEATDYDHRHRTRAIFGWLGFGVLVWSALAMLVNSKPSITQIIFAIVYAIGAYVCLDLGKWRLPTYLIASVPFTAVLEVVLYLLIVPLTQANFVLLVSNLGFLPLLQVLFIAYRYRVVYGKKVATLFNTTR